MLIKKCFADGATGECLGNFQRDQDYSGPFCDAPGAIEVPEGAWGQFWTGKFWQDDPLIPAVPEAEIAADPIQCDLPLEDTRLLEVKTYRDDPQTPDSTSALLDSLAVIGRVLTAQSLMTPEQLDALFAAAMPR